MSDLITSSNQTPIEIALGVDENGMTTAKKLYEFLGMDSSNYSRWCKSNITGNEFAEENVDYWAFVINDEWGGQATTDYKLTASFAKKLSMKGNGEKAEQARQYFITVEDKAKEMVVNRSQLSPQMQMLIGMVEAQAKQELEQKRQAEQLNRIEQKQDAIAETFQKVDDAEDFQRWTNSCITKIAESTHFDKGDSRSQKYSLARTESYERLKQKRNCRLDERV